MKITRITLGRTLNVGNYESVRFELSCDVEEEPLEKAYKALQKEVDFFETKLRREYKAKV